MGQIILSRHAMEKYDDLLQTIILQLNEYTKGRIIDFGNQGFEDISGNDICGIDDENVYIDYDFEDLDNAYPLHELDLMDAIRILENFENKVIGSVVYEKEDNESNVH